MAQLNPDCWLSGTRYIHRYGRMHGNYLKKNNRAAYKATVDFTGYNRRTVAQWIRLGKLRAFVLPQKYVIPKSYLIDWLCSDEYNNTNRKSKEHVDMLWELHKWNDGRR